MILYNWLELDRSKIISHIMMIKSDLIKKDILIDKFHRILTNHIHKLAPIKFKKNKNAHDNQNWIYIGGMYYSDLDQEKKKCIELIFEYSFLDETIYISNRKFNRICTLIADTLLHEIMHMQQYRSRKFKISSDYSSNALVDYVRREQEYLGCTDEMDAYSFNIACELIDYFGNDREQISKFLNDKILSKKKISPSWSKYFRAFEKNHNHPIIKRMKNKILKYIPRATSGKPYIRNQWINH